MNELVFLKNKEPVTTSLIIAEGTGNQHKSVIQLIDDHKAYFERWGQIYFSDLKTTNKFIDTTADNKQSLSKGGRGRPTRIAYLNEQQATFLITLLRNNDIVLDFKSELVDRFYKMREVLLNQRNEEWRAIRQAGKRGNKAMCEVIHDVIIPLARKAGSTTADDKFSKERKALAKELKECTRPKNWDNFNFYSKTFCVSGSYDNEDGYADDHHDMELVLNSYDVDWQGGAKEVEWDRADWDANYSPERDLC